MHNTQHDLTVIGAFVDHERVDPDALVEALSNDEGRQYLVELVMLHEVTSEQTMSSELRGSLPHGRSYRTWLAVAATVTFTAAGGYFVGQQHAAREQPAASRPSVQISTIPVVPVAPPPTRVITLEPGVNWHEEMGGGD